MPRRAIIDHRTAAGDICVLTAAFKAVQEQFPGAFELDYVGHHGRYSPENNLFQGNPYVTDIYTGPPNVSPDETKKHINGAQYIMADYGPGINSAGRSYHFLHAFVEDFERKLGVHIDLRDFRGDIYLSDAERQPWPGLPEKYAIIDAGIKRDFTAKGWSIHRFQEVVNATKDKIQWVQIGSAADIHPTLENVISLIGQTNLRQLCQVMHRASLVLTPISLPMHLCAAVEMPDEPHAPVPTPIHIMHQLVAEERSRRIDGRGHTYERPQTPARKIRPCIVLGGSREQRQWECLPGHKFFGGDRKLACGEGIGQACWRNKAVSGPKIKRMKVLNGRQIEVEEYEDNSYCRNPIQDEGGQYVPECLWHITVADVVRAVEEYL